MEKFKRYLFGLTEQVHEISDSDDFEWAWEQRRGRFLFIKSETQIISTGFVSEEFHSIFFLVYLSDYTYPLLLSK